MESTIARLLHISTTDTDNAKWRDLLVDYFDDDDSIIVLVKAAAVSESNRGDWCKNPSWITLRHFHIDTDRRTSMAPPTLPAPSQSARRRTIRPTQSYWNLIAYFQSLLPPPPHAPPDTSDIWDWNSVMRLVGPSPTLHRRFGLFTGPHILFKLRLDFLSRWSLLRLSEMDGGGGSIPTHSAYHVMAEQSNPMLFKCHRVYNLYLPRDRVAYLMADRERHNLKAANILLGQESICLRH